MDRKIAFGAMLCLYRGNTASEVNEALASAFDQQTLPPAQLIAVFDGPVSQDVVEVIDRYSEIHDVVRVRFESCRGHGAARAAAIEVCNHEWIAIIDADDVSAPNRFQVLFDCALSQPHTAAIGAGYVEFEVDSNGVKVFGQSVRLPEEPDAVRRYIALRSPVAQPTAILRVSAVRAVGNYQHWFRNEDYYLWIRLVSAGFQIRNVPDQLLWFRKTSNLITRRGGFKYWWSEVQLQLFSYRIGTTTLSYLVVGSVLRFIVQVLMPVQLRSLFYSKLLRNL